MRYNLEDIGAQIKKLRQESNLTQEQEVEIVPMSVTHLRKIENGKTNFSVDILLKFCQQFNVTPDYILCGGNDAVDEGFIEAAVGKLRLCDENDRFLILEMLNLFADRHHNQTESDA